MSANAVTLAVALAPALTATAHAATNPYASCPSIMSEADYLRAGETLTFVSRPNLETFPPGFLNKYCGGDISLSAVVLPDGTFVLGPHNHGVTCVPETVFMTEAATQSLGWHSGLIMDRLRTLRFKPPRLAGKPICVGIGILWKPDRPHRFFGAEVWRTRSKQK